MDKVPDMKKPWKTSLPLLGAERFYIKPEVHAMRQQEMDTPRGGRVLEDISFVVGLIQPMMVERGQELCLRIEGAELVIEVRPFEEWGP